MGRRNGRYKTTTFGQKGGESPTRGKTASDYVVTLPDGTEVTKRVFSAPTFPVGYARQYEGVWGLVTVAQKGKFACYTECPARLVAVPGGPLPLTPEFAKFVEDNGLTDLLEEQH